MPTDPSKVYGRGYQLGSVAPRVLIAYALIARVICRHLRPRTAIDLGSGAGAFVRGLREQGVFAFGVEGDREAVRVARECEIDVRYQDLRVPEVGWAERADLVTSFDVAEHIAKEHDDAIVAIAARSAAPGGTIIFGAAPPGQDGVDHVNLQPPEYWTAKFGMVGWGWEEGLTAEIRGAIEREPAVKHPQMDGYTEACHNVVWWVHKNMRVYREITPR